MQVDPKESRQAHPQTGRLTRAAASSFSQPDSLSPCDLRGPQPVPCRGDGAGQPIHLRPITLHRIFDPALRQRLEGPARHIEIPPHRHPQAQLLVYLIGAATLLIGIGIWFA